jgi:hypothetical protein
VGGLTSTELPHADGDKTIIALGSGISVTLNLLARMAHANHNWPWARGPTARDAAPGNPMPRPFLFRSGPLPTLPDRAYYPRQLDRENVGGSMERDDLGRFVPGASGNPGGRPKPPDGLRTRLAELSPRALERLGKLLDSGDERIRLEAAKAILDRHLGRPAIQADISLHRGEADGHLAALLEMARKRRAEPIDLDERDVRDITPCQSDPK